MRGKKERERNIEGRSGVEEAEKKYSDMRSMFRNLVVLADYVLTQY